GFEPVRTAVAPAGGPDFPELIRQHRLHIPRSAGKFGAMEDRFAATQFLKDQGRTLLQWAPGCCAGSQWTSLIICETTSSTPIAPRATTAMLPSSTGTI